MKFSVFVEPNNLSHRLDSNYYSPEDIVKEELIKRSNFDYLNNRAKKITGGATPKGSNYLNKGIAFIRTQNINNNLIDDKDLVYISSESNEELKRSQLKENDVLLTITGVDLGHSAVVSKAILPANINQHSVKIEVKNIDPHFLSVFLNSSYGQSQIWRRVYGVTRPAINYEEIKEIVIPVPSENIQNYIGNKVRKAEELRERAKENRREYTSLIDNYFSNVSKDKFPKGSFIINCQNIDSKSQRLDASFYNPIYKEYENLDIEYKKLGDLVKAKTNINPKSDVDYFYYEIGDMSNNVILDKEETIKGKNLPSRAKLNLSKYDIIVSLVQESIEVTSFVDIDRENMLTTNGCAVLAPKDISIAGYLYAIVSSPYFIAQKCRYISGTNIRSLSKEDLLQIPIPIFEYKIIEKINDLVKDEYYSLRLAKQLIREAKQDVEELIEGKFDESKISEGV